jgi:hypothetical protein
MVCFVWQRELFLDLIHMLTIKMIGLEDFGELYNFYLINMYLY